MSDLHARFTWIVEHCRCKAPTWLAPGIPCDWCRPYRDELARLEHAAIPPRLMYGRDLACSARVDGRPCGAPADDVPPDFSWQAESDCIRWTCVNGHPQGTGWLFASDAPMDPVRP